MSEKLMTDLALFAAAFLAAALVLGANSGVEHVLAAILGAR